MAEEISYIDITELQKNPAVKALLDKVREARRPLPLHADGEEVAVLSPAKQKPARIPRGRPITANDPYWSLVGIGRSEGPGDGSTNKRKYLVEAKLAKIT